MREKTNNLSFPTRSDTYRPVQSKEMVRGRKFWIYKVEESTIHVAKTQALISFAVTAKLICAFVFAYADCWFSHVAAHFKASQQINAGI